MGFRVFYGDASRHDLLEAAGIEKARLLIIAIDDPGKVLEQMRLAVVASLWWIAGKAGVVQLCGVNEALTPPQPARETCGF